MQREKGTLADLQLAHMRKMEAMGVGGVRPRPNPAPAAAGTGATGRIPQALLKQQFDVIAYLRSVRRPVTAEDILTGTGVNVSDAKHKSLFVSLSQNARVSYDPVSGRFTYRPAHDVGSVEDLVDLVAQHPDGVDSGELKDAHPGIAQIISQAIENHRVLAIKTRENGMPILFPNTASSFAELRVSQATKSAWVGVEMPDDFVVEVALGRIADAGFGVIPGADGSVAAPASSNKGRGKGSVTTGAKRRGGKSGEKRGGKARKLTNVHLLQDQ